MKIATTIQARMTSSRLPGKILKPVLGKPLLQYMIERLKKIPSSKNIIVATTLNKEDDPVEELARELGVLCYRGSEQDVLSRVLESAETFHVDLIVETTADCPLIDPIESEKVIRKFLEGSFDYVSNVLDRRYPRGMDTQIFSTKLLGEVSRLTQNPIDREHVSYYIYQHPEKYRLGSVVAPPKLQKPELRLTVDTPEDFTLIREIIEGLWPRNPHPSLEDILVFLDKNPELYQINAHIQQKTVDSQAC